MPTQQTQQELERSNAALMADLSSALESATALKSQQDEKYKQLEEFMTAQKKLDDERAAKAQEAGKQYAEISKQLQDMREVQKELKKQLDTPLLSGSARDMADVDRKGAVEFQRRAFLLRGGKEDAFKPDMENLISAEDYRSVVRKLSAFGMKTYGEITRSFTPGEAAVFKSMGSADLGVSFFMPELLGITVDCNPECGYLLDLYGQVSVSRSTFSFIQIKDYGQMGEFACSAQCDAPVGPDGNIVMQFGQTADFRGMFCFNLNTLAEANYPILPFMFRAAQRSYRINLNREMMVGDGSNYMTGWAHGGGGFPVYKTSRPQSLSPEDVRTFFNSVPREYGDVVVVMHQNTMALIATMKDANGRFIFGDGALDFSPEKMQSNIRVSNCLPDPTEKLTRSADQLVSGDFLMGAAHWQTAYYSVMQEPLTITQWPGGSNKWCVKYQFGARNGSFLGCSEAGRILKVQ